MSLKRARSLAREHARSLGRERAGSQEATYEIYTYDMATAARWKRDLDSQLGTRGLQEAVVITNGLSAEQGGQYGGFFKAKDEAAFPLEVLDKGIGFRCVDGAASVATDKDNILAAIGDGKERLDDTVHGVVAAAALARVLKRAASGGGDTSRRCGGGGCGRWGSWTCVAARRTRRRRGARCVRRWTRRR